MRKHLLLSAAITLSLFSYAQSTLVINEVDYDHAGNDSLEFIELYNASSGVIDLSAYRILFYNGATTLLYDSLQLPSYNLNPGAFYVICGAGAWVPNYNLLMADTFDIVQNAAATQSSGSPDALAIQLTGTTTIVDALSYEGSCASPFVETSGITYFNSDYNNDAQIGISRYPDGSDANDNSIDFGRRCITPGAPNVPTGANCGTVGINPDTQTLFNIYPNPANELVNIFAGANKNIRISVYDFTGKMIAGKEMKNVTGIVQYNT